MGQPNLFLKKPQYSLYSSELCGFLLYGQGPITCVLQQSATLILQNDLKPCAPQLTVIQQATDACFNFVETAQVWIKPFDEHTLKTYLSTEQSLGKAGAYSIQGEGAELIEKITGDYPTIVGLPF